MKIHKCGTEVLTKHGNFEGFITAVSIRFDAVLYEITHLSNGEFKTVWMNEVEFRTTGNRTNLGFR